ncbi:MAG: hypothetical protein QM783_07895 [Phycisphaerales bacterium]
MEDHKQGIKRLDEALKKLNEGGDPVVIGRELFEQFREQRRGPGNRGGEGARPGQGAGAGGGGAGAAGGGGGERQRSEYDITGPRLSPEEHAKVLAMLKEKHQPLLDKIDALSAGNDEMKQRLIDGVGPRMRWLEAMREREKDNKEKDNKEFELQAQNVSTLLDVAILGKAITDAEKRDDQAAAKLAQGKLVKVMNERFDIRQQISRLKLEQLRKQADELEKQLKKNDDTRDEVVQKRTNDYLAKIKDKEKPEKKGEPAPAKP